MIHLKKRNKYYNDSLKKRNKYYSDSLKEEINTIVIHLKKRNKYYRDSLKKRNKYYRYYHARNKEGNTTPFFMPPGVKIRSMARLHKETPQKNVMI